MSPSKAPVRSEGEVPLRFVGGPPSGSPVLDVVFVHGLGGDGTTTWLANGATESWLEWLSRDIESIAVWSLNYPAGATKWTSKGEGMALPERAASLIDTMIYYGIGKRSTVFVCHSLGGLVVKQILRHAAEMSIPEWSPLAESTIGVAFIATPHSGSDLATFAQAFGLARATRTTLALKAHCPHLKELADWYRQNVRRLRIETAAYAESRRVRRGIRLVTVVPTTSADPGIEGVITTSIDADHIDICKPVDRQSDAYRGIETFIRRQLKRIEQPDNVAASNDRVETQAAPSVEAPADLVHQIRELQAMRDLGLLDQVELGTLKMGILNRYYGVNDE